MAAKLKRKNPNKEQTLPIRLAYTIELPDDGREYGFLLPASKLPQVHIHQSENDNTSSAKADKI